LSLSMDNRTTPAHKCTHSRKTVWETVNSTGKRGWTFYYGFD
jgi:hypothetical protein